MSEGKQLLLLAVFVQLARCQQKPQVSISPNYLDPIFYGDLFYLSCDNSADSSTVKWYFNGKVQKLQNNTWKIAVASSEDSGNYQCESNGEKSDSLSINIIEFMPVAALTIMAGQPVMLTGSSVNLMLENDGGLQGWKCWVYREGRKEPKRIALRPQNASSLIFQTAPLKVPESIYWCTDNSRKIRSNQIILRASDKEISLEMYPLPAVAGKSLTLRCLCWGTDDVRETTFYKNNKLITKSSSSTHKIEDVKESTQGIYKCDATYMHLAHTAGPPRHRKSDPQDVFVQAPPVEAEIRSEDNGLSCFCSKCQKNTSYHWYHEKNTQQWELMKNNANTMTPKTSGTYACRAVWDDKRSSRSKGYFYNTGNSTLIYIGLLVLILLLGLIGLAVFYKYVKRSTTSQIYDDVELYSQVTGDRKYETLQKAHSDQRAGVYNILQPGTPGREKKKSDYEALRKEGMKEGVYHTLGMEGATGGEGGYQALKNEGMKEGVYHTLGMEGATGGEGGYQALKKEGMKEGVYHTLGMEGATGGEGGYQALKKEGMKDADYNTLGTQGATGGEGGYQALKKEGMKEADYNTLGTQGTVGGEG